MIDISIDLETLSSDPRGASIAAIGLVAQDFQSGQEWEWYRIVNDPDGIIEPETVRWHISQENPVLNVGLHEHAMRLGDALAGLSALLKGPLKAHKEGEARIWTHTTFDVPQVACAYKRVRLKRPWHYRNCRDLRTLYDLAGGRPQVDNPEKHHALADARKQLEEVRLCLTRLGKLWE